MNIKKIAKEISESMYPHLEIGAMDYKKKDRERLVSIVETKLNNNEVLDLVMLTPDAIAKHLEWDSYHHMMINEDHIDHQLKEAINMLFFTNKLEVPFG